MSAQIAIEQGREPWAPAADAELVRTLHVYDMPLIGVIRQGGSLHLFRCIEGHVDAMNLWAYTPLDPEDDLAALESASPDMLDDVIDGVVEGRPVVVALSREADGILASALVREPGRHATLLHAAREALRTLSEEIDVKLTALG
jgi:hypothetical protein